LPVVPVSLFNPPALFVGAPPFSAVVLSYDLKVPPGGMELDLSAAFVQSGGVRIPSPSPSWIRAGTIPIVPEVKQGGALIRFGEGEYAVSVVYSVEALGTTLEVGPGSVVLNGQRYEGVPARYELVRQTRYVPFAVPSD
jgi:hypothetical protein